MLILASPFYNMHVMTKLSNLHLEEGGGVVGVVEGAARGAE